MSSTTLDPPVATAAQPEPVRELRGGLLAPGFLGLLVTQFLGAFNDNVYRWLIVSIGKDYVGKEQEPLVLTLGASCLVLPFLLLAAHAGYLADRYSKRSVLIGCKVAEILIMGLAVVTIANVGAQSFYLLFAVLLLMGGQSALFGPAKFGVIPEIVRPEKISAANGVIGLSTIAAVVLGTIVGNLLDVPTGLYGQERLWLTGSILLGVAALGWLASLTIGRTPVANPALAFPRNPFVQTFRDIKLLGHSRALLRVALGVTFFWSLASLAQLNTDSYVIHELGLKQEQVGPLVGILALGVGIGSALAGVMSRGRIELGLVPLGAAGIAVSAMALFLTGDSYIWTCLLLFSLGTFSGIFDIPLQSFLQHRSPPEHRGAILAASNFLTFSGMLLFNGVFWLLGQWQVSPRGIFLFAGLWTLPVAAYALLLLPQATIRFVVWLASLTVYRVRVYGHDNLPERGGALLVPNHVTWVDGVLLLLTSSRPIRMVVYADYIEGWWIRWLARLMGAIPIKPGRKSMVESIRLAREALRNGDLVCVFPEGALTRTGQMQSFKPGFLSIIKDTGAPVIPVFLDELWGSIFSFRGGRYFWKWPRRWPYTVSIHFGRPLVAPDDPFQVRQAVQALGVEAVEKRAARSMILPRLFLRMCRRSLWRSKVADSLGTELTGGTLLMRTLILRRLLRRLVLSPDEKYVGLLLPPSAGAVICNAALPLDGRIAVNLNYTVSADVMNSCLAQCGIKHVLTTRKVMSKLDMQLDAEVVYLDDFKDQVTLADKLVSAVQAYAYPVSLLERRLGLLDARPDDLLTVVFTSGSTGEPKGVMLSHQNVGSNVEAIDHLVNLRKDDVLAGILPFFHSFGYTTTMWTVLTLDLKGVYHFSPLDARQLGDLCKQQRATILISTPTFLRSYLRRCAPEDFAALEVVVAGAEKLPTELCDAFEQKFGVRPVEGYGATELSPLVAVNVPACRAAASDMIVAKEGTVGRPIPGVTAKIVHPETGAELGVDQPGMLLITGPNVMRGYMHKPELTAKVLRDGWYVTGDIALVDADGFIRITGRQSRFSKIGGEMVPHIRIEEELQRIVGQGEDEIKVVVTAVPDARKGERIVVMHTALGKAPAAIVKELSEAGLPNLWIPSPDSFCLVETIPVLGTGKLDLKGLKDLALEKFGEPART